MGVSNGQPNMKCTQHPECTAFSANTCEVACCMDRGLTKVNHDETGGMMKLHKEDLMKCEATRTVCGNSFHVCIWQ
jgi:hypothetical protein